MKKIFLTSFLGLMLFANKAMAIKLESPIAETDPRVIIGNIISALLGLVGIVALILFIWGGFQLMTSSGSSDKITKGRDTMVWAAIGLAIIFASYALTRFVIDAVAG